MGLPRLLSSRASANSPATSAAGASHGGGWVATQPDPRTLMRLIGLQYFMGAAVIAMGCILPTDDPSDRPALWAIAALVVACGAFLQWSPVRKQLFVDFGIFGLILLVTAVVVVSRPMGLSPLFYFWPLMLSAYYASPARLVGYTTLAIGLFGLAVATAAQTENPPLEFVEFAAMTTVVVLAVRKLRGRIIELFDELDRLASRDTLTGVLNRGAFERALVAEVPEADGAAPRPGSGAALLMLDVDYFKAINDEHGHAGGDQALRTLISIVERTARPSTVVGRVGGEEFGLLLPGASLAEAGAVAESIRVAVAERSPREGIAFTVSIGVAPSGCGETMWSEADRALYRAKRAGRNRVELAPALTPVGERAA